MTDREFLHWLRDRLVFVYNVHPGMDYVTRLLAIAHATQEGATTTNAAGWCNDCTPLNAIIKSYGGEF